VLVIDGQPCGRARLEKLFTVEAFTGKMTKYVHNKKPFTSLSPSLRRGIFDRGEEFRREVSNGFARGEAQ
jgi:hypothetical protein